MRWKITIEGLDEFSGRDAADMVIEKDVGRLSNGEIGLTIADGKSIMACLQQLVVKQQCEAYVLTSRYCTDCQTFRRIKDYGKRKLRTVYGRVEVSNPRIMNCRRCVPYFCDASAVLRGLPHFLLQWSHRKQARTEEFWSRATIHRPLERFQAIDLSFRLAVAPWLSDRISHRVDVSLRRARETLNRVQA